MTRPRIGQVGLQRCRRCRRCRPGGLLITGTAQAAVGPFRLGELDRVSGSVVSLEVHGNHPADGVFAWALRMFFCSTEEGPLSLVSFPRKLA